MPPRKGLKEQSVGPPDLLTNLPTGIIAKILGHVPIREAVRTSVLSSQWRYTWCSIPNLVFEDSCVKLPNKDKVEFNEAHDNTFVSFVYRVLFLHQGPVHKFEVVGNSSPKFDDIYQWVTFLSRNGINELYLEFGYYSKMPSSLFQCGKLTALSLGYLESLELPVGFGGFMLLKRLVLERVKIAIRSLEKLVSGSPLLEILELYDSHSEVLKIHAPLLKYLHLDGGFEGFILEKTPLLEEISVRITNDVTENSCILIQFIDEVPWLQKLVGLEYFTKYWTVGKDTTTIAITLNHLRFIKLSLDFEDLTEVHLLLRLLSRSPVLNELEIIVSRGSSPEGPAYSDSELCSEANDLGVQLLQLKKVTVRESVSSKEIEFVKFLLHSLPALETLTVTRSSDLKDGSKKILISLLRCRRASSNAEVVFCDD